MSPCRVRHVLIVSAVLALGCGVKQQGLANVDRTADGGARDARDGAGSDLGPPETGSPPLPGGDAGTTPFWTCGGGGAARTASAQLGVTVGGVAPVNAVTAPSGARITLGHFVHTVE
jgi:hypothetical protein